MQNWPDVLLLIGSFSLGINLGSIFAIKCWSTGNIMFLHRCTVLMQIFGLEMSEQGWIYIERSLVLRHWLNHFLLYVWVGRCGCRISFGLKFALHLLETWVDLTALFWHAVLSQRSHRDSDCLQGAFRANLFEILGVFAGDCLAGRDGHLPLLLVCHGHRFKPTKRWAAAICIFSGC